MSHAAWRRAEMLGAAALFAALGGAFVWSGSRDLHAAVTATVLRGGWLVALGSGTALAAVLFVRVRWRPPAPGPPVPAAPRES